MRPLDRVRSIKLKLSIVIVAAVAISALVSTIGLRLGIPVWTRPVISGSIALLLVYPLSRGMTAPLRQMATAARAMARGDYTQPVTATAADEVGELARAFDAMRSQLAQVDRQRRDLVANVSHELRTPLAGLRARFENMVDGVEPTDPENLRTTLVEIERLSGLVEQLLDLSRIDARSPLHVEEFDVAPLLHEVATGLRQREGQVEVVVQCPADLLFRGDPGRLRQVLANLTDNAARYSPAGQPITLQAEDDGTALRLLVADRGPGIAPEERSRVFERFYRSDHGRSVHDGGAGLGLAIVRGIVELHDGTVEIHTHPPRGCQVVVSLPHHPGAK